MYLENPSIKKLISYIKANRTSQNEKVLFLVGESCELNLEDLVRSLNKEKILFVGGVFPKVIYKNNTSAMGIIIKHIQFDAIPIYYNNDEEFSEQFSDYKENNFTTVFTLTDGFSDSVSSHLRTLFTYLGHNVKFFGGGVGRLQQKHKGILFNNDGVYEKGTIAVLLRTKIQINAYHTWKKLTGPFIVTKSYKNLIQEINWENAFHIYTKHLAKACKIELTPSNFQDYAIQFPLGICKEERNYIVREPIKVTNNGYLQCVGNIPENSLIDILTIDENNLKNLPKFMVASCTLTQKKQHPLAMIFSCISREKPLNELFITELNEFNKELNERYTNFNLEGALSIGEVFSDGSGYLELLNKSVVLGFSYYE